MKVVLYVGPGENEEALKLAHKARYEKHVVRLASAVSFNPQTDMEDVDEAWLISPFPRIEAAYAGKCRLLNKPAPKPRAAPQSRTVRGKDEPEEA